MNIKKRKRNKHKQLLLLIVSLITISCLITIKLATPTKNSEDSKQEQTTIKTEEIITQILSYQKEAKLTKDFLNWIEENYNKETLMEIKNNLDKNTYTTNLWHKLTNNSLIVLLDKYNQTEEPNKKTITTKTKDTTISFVGDVSLADNWYIMPKYDERNKKIYGILSEQVVNTMTTSDLMIANNEFTISDRGTKIPNKLYTFRASPSRLDIYKEMGVGLVTLANNHIYDFGETAFSDTLKYLKEKDIPYIGAGANIEEAKKPYYFIVNGYKIGFVNATRAEKFILTPEATETTGGVLRCYDPTAFKELIEETKKHCDYLVALVHWGTEDSTKLETAQLETSKIYLDAGADIIIGSHAHILQGIDFYNNKAIIYNLGDFIFNNETKDTGIFQLKINEDGTLKYFFIPCKEENEYTYLLENEEKQRVLNKMQELSPNITIKEDGEFIPK